jgi:hypothetical protein
MSVSRRAVTGLAIVAVTAAALILLIARFSAQPGQTTNTTAPETAPADRVPVTSEELIAAALKAGDLTYEESLLQRAYAIFDDPRQDRQFRSPVINWPAAVPLLHEINEKEQTLSAHVLEELLPFRVRPSDPRSIVNRPRAEVLPADNPRDLRWRSYLVPRTTVRIWMMGTEQVLRDKYAPLVQQVWGVFDRFFPHPTGDDGRGDPFYDIDEAIDVYLVEMSTLDPRRRDCSPGQFGCSLDDLGYASGYTPDVGGADHRRSGYVLADIGMPDDVLQQVIAHELAHVTQHNFDTGEALSIGIGESTATWVEYKVTKAINKVPDMAYSALDPAVSGNALFNVLHQPLNTGAPNYRSWLFYLHASMDLGDDVVTRIWQRASREGFDGYKAVDEVVPFKTHFPTFTVRNWNIDPVPAQYKTRDSGFRPQRKPTLVKPMPSGVGEVQLNEPLPEIAARYYHYTAFDDAVRRITVQNFYAALSLEQAHVWAIKKIAGDWKPPEDWSGRSVVVLCRDLPDEAVSELVLIVSNSDMTQSIPAQHPHPHVLSEDVGCETVEGTARATLRLKDPETDTDMSYVANFTTVQFKPRSVQDQLFNTEYDLLPTSVVWIAAGKKDGCAVEGRAVARIPSFQDLPLDPTRPAYGYLNIVGEKGGDFHSVKISAIPVEPGAQLTKTCPGNPPVVTREPFRVQWLLMILTAPNIHTGNAVMFAGTQTFDPARIQDNMPMNPSSALSGLLNSAGRGFITPEIQRQLKEAQEALDRVAAERSGRMVYTFEWELKPRVRTP